MNNIVESIESIINIKNDLKNSINNKDINIENYIFSNYSEAINTYSSNKYTPEYLPFSYYPYNTINITTIDLNHLTNTSQMFRGCSNLTNIPNFNTSNVTSMSWMFQSCSNLTNIPNFDTSNVTSMSGMFSLCSNLVNIIDYNTSNVINMSSMFQSCYNLTNIPNFDTSNVTSMSQMFYYCNNLTTVPNFDTSNVINMSQMFYNCSNLTAVPNFDTSNVTSMSQMFSYCSNLTDISNFDTSNVINIYYMFYNCFNITTIPQFNNLSNAFSFAYSFFRCYNLSHDSIVNAVNSFKRIPRTSQEYYSNIFISGLTNTQLFSYIEPIHLENVFTNFYSNNLPVSFSTSKKLSNHDCMSGVQLNFTYPISNAAQASDFINIIQNLPRRVVPYDWDEPNIELVKFYPKYTYKNMEPTENDIINNEYCNSSGAIYATVEGGMGGRMYYQLTISAVNTLNPECNNMSDWNTYSNCHFEEWLAEVVVYSSNNTVSEYHVNPNIQLPDYIGRTYIQSSDFKNSPLYSNISFNGYSWS